MLIKKMKVSASSIHGIGLFADEDIKAGDVVWEYNPLTTQVFSKSKFYLVCQGLSLQAIGDLINFSYIKNNKIYYINDNTRFINHSTHPNIRFDNDNQEIALRDISKGEEITENYLQSYDENDFFVSIDIDQHQTIEELLFTLNKVLKQKTKSAILARARVM